MNLVGVLWDMDNVLVKTEEYHYVSWKQTLGEYGISFSYPKFQSTFGMNNKNILTEILGQHPLPDFLEEVSRKKEGSFRNSIHGLTQLLPGVRFWLERFASWHVYQAVASSAPLENIDFMVDELGIRRYFTALVSAYELPGKPNPDVFLTAARALEVDPSQCLVIEDSVVGVEAAQSAGMRCVAVTTTYSREMLTKADRIVDRLDHMTDDMLHELFI
jgi:beta-phosphoglucomutase-like phosphatase (HAD superfamily)